MYTHTHIKPITTERKALKYRPCHYGGLDGLISTTQYVTELIYGTKMAKPVWKIWSITMDVL